MPRKSCKSVHKCREKLLILGKGQLSKNNVILYMRVWPKLKLNLQIMYDIYIVIWIIAENFNFWQSTL